MAFKNVLRHQSKEISDRADIEYNQNDCKHTTKVTEGFYLTKSNRR